MYIHMNTDVNKRVCVSSSFVKLTDESAVTCVSPVEEKIYRRNFCGRSFEQL